MRPTSSCDDVLEMLPLFVGGDLEDASRIAVAEHLAGCSACREAESRASAARDALVAELEDEVRGGGPALWPGIQAELVRDGILEPAHSGRGRLLSGPWRRVAAGLAAAAVVSVLVVPRMFGPANSIEPDTPDIVVDDSPELGGTVLDPSDKIVDATPGVQPEEPAKNGLIQIKDQNDLLLKQLTPVDPRNQLTSSPSTSSPVR